MRKAGLLGCGEESRAARVRKVHGLGCIRFGPGQLTGSRGDPVGGVVDHMGGQIRWWWFEECMGKGENVILKQ